MKRFWEQTGLNPFFMMYRFFGKAYRLYLAGVAAAASSNLLSNVFAGQLYAVITRDLRTMSQFAAGFYRAFLLLVTVVAITGTETALYLFTTARADFRLRKALTERCLHMLSEWTKRHSTDWLCVTGRDADDASAIYKEYSQRLLCCVISVAGGLGIMLLKSPVMALFAVLVGFFYIGIGISRTKTRKEHESLLRGGVSGIYAVD